MRTPFDGAIIYTPEGAEGLYQSIAFLATAVDSTAITTFNTQGVTTVLLFATQDCHIRSSAAGTAAVATDMFIPASVLIPVAITSGYIISAIRDSADGTLHISPVI